MRSVRKERCASRHSQFGPASRSPREISDFPSHESLYSGKDVFGGRKLFTKAAIDCVKEYHKSGEHQAESLSSAEWIVEESRDAGFFSEKLIIVGDANVGKTALTTRVCEDRFEENYKATIGLNLFRRRYAIMSVPFVMNIWDTAGQEKFRSLTRSFYRGSGACILAFDLSMDTSLKNTYYWMEELKREWRDDIGIFVCGLKSDLYHVVDTSRGEEVAEYLGGEYWECSAKTGENVSAMFDRVAVYLFEEAIRRQKEGREHPGSETRRDQKVALERDGPSTSAKSSGSKAQKCCKS